MDWFNTRRLLSPIGYVPPAEYEAQYYNELAARGRTLVGSPIPVPISTGPPTSVCRAFFDRCHWTDSSQGT